ncbi:MAG: sulfotransferase domain-containing protein [Cyclobacteriaceae bacterium]
MTLVRKTVRFFEYLGNWRNLKKTDIWFVSFPKSGNTWVRYFYLNFLAREVNQTREYSFEELDEFMPEFGNRSTDLEWNFDGFPRLLKTHHAYNGIVHSGRKCVLLIRDPRDVMISYHKFLIAKARLPKHISLSDFIQHPQFGISSWAEHYNSWKTNTSKVIIHYEKLLQDPINEFSRMLEFCNVKFDKNAVIKAVEQSNFESFKKIEKKFGTPKSETFDSSYNFIRSGKEKQWKKTMNQRDLDSINAVLIQFDIHEYLI